MEPRKQLIVLNKRKKKQEQKWAQRFNMREPDGDSDQRPPGSIHCSMMESKE